jgi:HD-GYP domain-containing protein (c-di-GMP phosphodiesterase class II)
MDEQGNPQDYVFLEINYAFEQITGFKACDILGQRITRIIPDIQDGQLDWIDTFSSVALHGTPVSFEQYSPELDRWYCVSAYSHKPVHFILVFSDISDQKRDEKELINSLDSLRNILHGTVATLAALTEMRDPYTAGHQRRVAQLACAIAKEMGLGEDQIECINIASALHDIGKIYIPAELLNKPGRLNEIEFGIIKRHPQASYEIVKSIEFPWPIDEIIWQHHERIDGSGYPRGLRGNDIDLEARILCVADTVEAMSSCRPYRTSLGVEAALECIWLNSGSRYDSDVVTACLRLFTEGRFRFQSDQSSLTNR